MPRGFGGSRFGPRFPGMRDREFFDPRDLRPRGPFMDDYEDGSKYRDYNDSNYTDHYEDNNYQDNHDPDRVGFGRSRRPDPFQIDPGFTHKVVIVTPESSKLLPGDADHTSGLFEASVKDENGVATDALPKLLDAGWLVHSIEPGLGDGQKLIVLARPKKAQP